MKNFKHIKAIESKNKEKILQICPNATETSGIYIFTREENGFRYAYIGQAKHLLTRLAQHLLGYQHIDLSLKKHGFRSPENPTGWEVNVSEFEENVLDETEKFFINLYANEGYQLRNKTAGGQGKGKFGIAENKPSKTYRDGLKQGYENARRDVRKWFEKYLCVVYENCDVQNEDKPPKANEKKAMEKFEEFIKGEKLWTKN